MPNISLPEIDESRQPQIHAGEIIQTEMLDSFNFQRDIAQAAVGIPAAFVDTTVSSLANISDATGLTDFNLENGIMPEGWDAYNRNRDAWRATADIAGLFLIAGQATRAIQSTSKLATFAKKAGLKDSAAQKIFADRVKIKQIDDEIDAVTRSAGNQLADKGLTSPVLTTDATAWQTLSGNRLSIDGARLKSLGARTDASIKETIAAEVAIGALMNDSDLLFPSDATLGEYLMTAGIAGGVVAGIDRVIGARVHRKMLANATADFSAQAKIARANGATYDNGTLAKGERWTVAGAAMEEMKRADELIADSATASNKEAGEIVRASGVRIRQTAQSNANKTLRKIYADDTLKGVSQRSSQDAISNDRVDLAREYFQKDLRRMIGVSSLEDATVVQRFDDEMHSAIKAVDRAKKKQNKDAVEAAQKRVQELENHHVGVIEADGSVNISVTRNEAYQETLNSSPRSKLRYGSKRKKTFRLDDANAPNVELADTGVVMRKSGKLSLPVTDLSKLSFSEATSLYKAASLGLRQFSENSFGKTFAESYSGNLDDLPMHVADGIARGKFDFAAAGTVNRKELASLEVAAQNGELDLASFKKKFDTFAKIGNGETPHDLSKRLNLKLVNEEGEANELYNAMKLLNSKGYTNLDQNHKGQTFQQIVKTLSGAAGDLGAEQKIMSQITGGNMLDLHEKARPVGFVKRTFNGATDADDSFAAITQTRRDLRMEQLRKSESPLIKTLANTMRALGPIVDKAMDVGALAQDGYVHSNSVIAGLSRNVTQTTARLRELKTIQHTHTVGTALRRASDVEISAIVDEVAEAYGTAVKNQDYETLAAHSDFTAIMKSGGELAEDNLVEGVNALDHTKPNVQSLVQNLFGKTVDDFIAEHGAVHVFDKAAAYRGQYRPIHFSQNSADLINKFVDASYADLEMRNELGRMMGHAEVRRKRGHMPVVNFRNREMRYISDKNGKVIGYVEARTGKEADKLRTEMINIARERGDQWGTTSEAQVQNWINSHDGARFASLRDFSDPIMQTGPSKGKNLDLTRDVSGDVGQDQLISLRNTLQGTRDDTIHAMFEGQILKNRELGKVGDSTEFGTRRKSGKERKFFSANEEWENVLMGRSNRPEASFAQGVDDLIVPWLENVFERAAQVHLGLKDKIGLTGKHKNEAIDKLVTSGYDPMGSAAQYLLKVDNSPSNRALANNLQAANKATAEVLLKFANLPHAILNVLSTATTVPAVAQMLIRRSGETIEDWRDRAGAWSDFMDGDSVATASVAKIASQGWETFHSAEGKRILEEANKLGLISSNMLEETNKAIFSTPSKAGEVVGYIRKYGDFINLPINKGFKAVTGKEKQFDTISESSEVFVRGLFHTMGYQFAKQHMPDATEAMRQQFGHYFANQNIADFSPNIRGQAFRGVSGIPIGLFQSFGLNYMQRVFRFVEDADKRALLVQGGTQGLMFGGEGIPGYPALNEAFFNIENRGGENDGTLTDRVYKAYGSTAGDVLFTGAISNIPRLMGADTGINFYTSGDANPRAPNLLNLPSFSVAGQALTAVRKAFSSEAENLKLANKGASYDSSRTGEILTSYMPIRGYRSMMELAMGYSTDRAGDLVIEDTRSGINAVARLLGTRTTSEVRKRAAMRQNGVDGQHRRARLQQIGRQFTARVRDLGGTATEEGERDGKVQTFLDSKEGLQEFDAFLARWTAQGGRLDTAKTAFNRMLDKAFTPEDIKEMNKYVNKDGTLKGGDVYQFMLERMMQYGFSSEDVRGLSEK